ncbi:MAG: 50S ribosomal protein L25/general stress protein Ctc [Chromatiales bacterium]|jgi:large subunit ribosomal protein L25|nr:50S ribosomal protein L25/general stress protein Ctc [Chromatiales bacterium]
MAINFELRAQVRTDAGKGASRRLRREGKVPAILYGAGEPPLMLLLDHNPVMHSLENEAFYSHVLNVNIDGKSVRAVLKDLQRHPYRAIIMHLDLQRVSETEKLRMTVPLHFLGEEVAPGVKLGGGIIVHMLTEVEVSCLPKDLPEYLEVDVSHLNLNETLHLSNIRLPSGVEIIELMHGAEHDQPVVSVHVPRAAVETDAGAAPAAGTEGA